MRSQFATQGLYYEDPTKLNFMPVPNEPKRRNSSRSFNHLDLTSLNFAHNEAM